MQKLRLASRATCRLRHRWHAVALVCGMGGALGARGWARWKYQVGAVSARCSCRLDLYSNIFNEVDGAAPPAQDCCARKPCPPSIADRPKTCQPESKAHLDAINALFYQASSVYFLTANCYETAEEEPKELLPILNFLTDMGDLLCYTRPGKVKSSSCTMSRS